MTQDDYKKLTDQEKIVYDEFVTFTRTLLTRIDVLTEVAQKLLAVATEDP